MIRIVLFFLLTGITAVQASPEKTQVLSTIKPIHLIVREIARDKADTLLLIPDQVSVHDYSFKPSDIRKIKSAELVFRIDQHLESILSPVLEKNVATNQLISLAEQNGIDLLTMQSNGHQHGSGDDEHENTDLHIWSSPVNAMAMADAIASTLSEVDPKNSNTYHENLLLFKREVLESSKRINLQLSSVKHKPYVVFHNSWHYFSHYFGLQEAKIVSLHNGLGGNIKSILDVRKKIKADKIGCIISDPSVSPARVDTIIENLQVKAVQIDSLASDVLIDEESTSNTYVIWLEALATKVNHCLSYEFD